MSNARPLAVSEDLASVIEQFQEFLLADDEERSRKLEASDSDTLQGLAETVEPMFDEINATLDQADVAPSLSGDEQDLQSSLHSLAQVGIEARIVLEDRGDERQ